MRLRDLFTTAAGNMFRSKLRTSLTVLAIFIGAFTLTITTGIGAGISKYIDQQVNNIGAKDVLIIQAADTSAGITTTDAPKKYDPTKKIVASSNRPGANVTVLTDTDVATIKALSGIKTVTPSKTVAPDYITGQSADKFQISVSQFIPGSHLTLAAGQSVNETATRNEVLVPISYVLSLGYDSNEVVVGQPVRIGLSDSFGKVHEATATVVGVLQKSLVGGTSITVNSKLLNELYSLQVEGLPMASVNNYQMVTAQFDTSLSAAQVTALKTRLKNKGYTATTVEDQIGTFKAVINAIIAVLNAFAIIALLAASFGIINTLLMSVQERTKEIGLMKAMGMSGARIFVLFSLEAILLGFFGSAIGIVVAEVVGNVANRIVSNGFLKDLAGLHLLTFTPQSILSIVGLVMGIAFLAGTLPAYRAARQSPIDSLRYE
jgi:putative ABC transport system permease protein